MCDDHVSLYQLTLERGTPLHKDVKSGKIVRFTFYMAVNEILVFTAHNIMGKISNNFWHIASQPWDEKAGSTLNTCNLRQRSLGHLFKCCLLVFI